MNSRFVRSRNGALFGVCKGLAGTFHIPVGWVRLLSLLLVFAGGMSIWIYALLAVTLPREDQMEKANRPRLMGVCLRIGRRMGIEVGVVRFLALLAVALTGGAAIVLYLVANFILDDYPEKDDSRSNPSTPPSTM